MKKRYSKYIYPLLLTIDILIINAMLFFVFKREYHNIYFNLYLALFWIISSWLIGYYKVYRHTNFFKLLTLIFKQSIVLCLGFFAYFGIFQEGVIVNTQFNTLLSILSLVLLFKVIFFLLIKNYRRIGKNYRKVVFLGYDTNTKKLIQLFQQKKYLGYSVEGFFSDVFREESTMFLGENKKVYNYVTNTTIDEIYVSLSLIKKEEIKKLNKFTSKNNIQLKLIPNSNELYSKNQEVEVYEDAFKVLSIKKLPFELYENRLLKRTFDISFSLIVIFLLMSWLTPILWVLIKLESRGSLFFKQEREGLNGERFMCYKFRSMRINKDSDLIHATKNDTRVTKVGAFIRKTSIDELPQFFNVLFGEMSVVGPRPHMDLHSLKFEKEIENYVKRHAVKPGITGLAQIKGYRGEIKKKSDIENRVRLDIFYIENWSFLFDLKIIINTIFNVFEGEENAY